MAAEQDDQSEPVEEKPTYREVRYEHTKTLAPLLDELQATLLISTYQAGKLAAVSAVDGEFSLSFHNFVRPMGVAIRPGAIAVAARGQVWFLKDVPDIARRLEPAGRHDACYLTRSAHVTGEIQAHEMAFAGDELWIVNTMFSCLCTLDTQYNFVPRWRPPFITALAAEDRCHLNGLAMADGRPKYVTALAETDTAAAWRADKVNTGCLIEVDSGKIIARDFAMPHSPRVVQGQVLLLDSGRGRLVRVDPKDGSTHTICQLPGYTRGMAVHGPYAFVGLSKIRETSTFGGVPIAADSSALKCGVGVVDLRDGSLPAHLEFTAGVDEIFDISLLPGVRSPVFRGPYAEDDGEPAIWTVPQPEPPDGSNGR